MRILFIFLFVLLHAYNVDKLIKTVPKNSPEYNLDIVLYKKIKEIKPQHIQINENIKNEKEYIDAFFKLIKLKIELKTLPKKIDELEEKLSILNNAKTTTQKLQYIYYQKLKDSYVKTLESIKNIFPEYEKFLYKKLKDIGFDTNKAQKNIKELNNQLIISQKYYEKLKIDLQKWQLLNNQEEIEKIQRLLQNYYKNQKRIYKELFKNKLIIWLNDIKNKNKKAFEDDDEVLNYAKHLGDNWYEAVNSIVGDFEGMAFGSKLLLYNTKKEAEITFEKIKEIINYPLFTVGNKTITPINFAIMFLILIIGWYIGKYYKKTIYKLRKKYNFSHSTATLLGNMGYYTILTATFLIALKSVGLDLSSLTIIAGALSVGIGFGLQNIVSNFVSGIILMFENSIKVGDYIQIDENTRGEVVDISMRSTVIRTNDNIDLIIPNQTFIQNNVINWTLQDEIVRFRVPFGVAYGSDIDKVEKVILEALRKSNIPYVKKHTKFDVTPRVVFMEMADSSLNFELFVWVRGEDARRPRRTKGQFLKLIYNALNKAGINIPFPQHDLHIKDSVPFEIKIKKE
jgi:small-conductance mechanosensitive channel